jgi:hypothetical protein
LLKTPALWDHIVADGFFHGTSLDLDALNAQLRKRSAIRQFLCAAPSLGGASYHDPTMR